MKLKFHPEAEFEFNEAIRFFSVHEGTGERFTLQVQKALDTISASPRRWRLVKKNIRRCLCTTYPYAILYSIEPKYIFVIAVMHLHRDPSYWQIRTTR